MSARLKNLSVVGQMWKDGEIKVCCTPSLTLIFLNFLLILSNICKLCHTFPSTAQLEAQKLFLTRNGSSSGRVLGVLEGGGAFIFKTFMCSTVFIHTIGVFIEYE